MERIRRSFRRGEKLPQDNAQEASHSCDVFICHTSPKEAGILKLILQSRGLTVGLSQAEQIKDPTIVHGSGVAGNGGDQVIGGSTTDVLLGAKTVVVLLDNGTLLSMRVQKELRAAKRRKLVMLCVAKRKIAPETVRAECPEEFIDTVFCEKGDAVPDGEAKLPNGKTKANARPAHWLVFSEREPQRSLFVSQLLKALQLVKKAKKIRVKPSEELLLKSKLEEYEDGTRKWVFSSVVQWFIRPAWKNRLVVVTGKSFCITNDVFLSSLF